MITDTMAGPSELARAYLAALDEDDFWAEVTKEIEHDDLVLVRPRFEPMRVGFVIPWGWFDMAPRPHRTPLREGRGVLTPIVVIVHWLDTDEFLPESPLHIEEI